MNLQSSPIAVDVLTSRLPTFCFSIFRNSSGNKWKLAVMHPFHKIYIVFYSTVVSYRLNTDDTNIC